MRKIVVAALLTAGLAASAALAQVKLEWKRQPESVTTTSTVMKQLLTIAGQAIPTEAQTTMVTRSKATEPAADGTHRVEEKTEAYRVRMKLPGNLGLDFDSAKPGEAKAAPPLEPLLEGLKVLGSASYVQVIDREGRVKSVEGADQVLARLPAASQDAFRDQLDPQRLTRQAEQELRRLPDKPVKKGDRWLRTETMDIGGGQQLTFDIYYEYQGSVEKGGRTLDKIGVFRSSVKYAQSPNAAGQLKHLSSDLKIESSSGTLYFDREAGLVLETTESYRITGPMTFEVNGMQLASSLDLTVENSTATKQP